MIVYSSSYRCVVSALLVVLSVFWYPVLSQHDYIFIRGSLSTTLSTFQFDFMGETKSYHPASGIAAELGYERETGVDIHPYISIGYLLNGQYFLNNTNGFKTRSFFKFNRSYLTGGFNYHIKTKKKYITSIAVGTGGNYNLPSKLILQENNQKLKSLSYSPSAGFHFDLLFKLRLNESFHLEPQFRLRFIQFDISTNNLGDLADVAEYYQELNVSNIEAGLKASIRL